MPIYVKRALYVLLGFILLIIVLAAFFMGYLQLSTFSIGMTNYNSTNEFIEQGGVTLVEHREDDNYDILFPMELLNEEITKLFIQTEYSREIELSSAKLDLVTGTGQINYELNGFYVPVNCQVTHSAIPTGHKIVIKSISYGESKINMPDFIDKLFFEELFGHEITLVFEPSNYFKSVFFAYQNSEISDKGLRIDLKLNIPYVEQFMLEIEENLDEELVEIYQQGTDEQQEALRWINEYTEKKGEITSAIFEDYHGDGAVLKELVILAPPLVIKSIYSEYEELNEKVRQDEVIAARGELIGDAVVVYTQMLLESLQTYSDEGSLVRFRNEIFDLDLMVAVDEVSIRDRYNLEIDDESLSKMKLIVKGDQIYITYDTGENTYIVAYLGGFLVVDEEEYMNTYTFEKAPLGQVTSSAEIYDKVITGLVIYYNQEVFIRYLADDGQQAFALISTVNEPQDIIVVGLEKTEQGDFYVIGAGYKTIFEMSQALSHFNLNLTSREFETVEFKKLNSSSVSNALDGLRERGYMTGNEMLSYYSYDGSRLIYLLLSSGEEYIYTVYRSQVLEDVFTLEVALKYFDEMPNLLIPIDRPAE